MTASASQMILRFAVEGKVFAIFADSVPRIQRSADIEINSGGEPYGWIRDGGLRRTVIDAARILHLRTEPPAAPGPLLQLREVPNLVLMVDAVYPLTQVRPENFHPMPESARGALGSLFRGIWLDGDRMVPVLSANLAATGDGRAESLSMPPAARTHRPPGEPGGPVSLLTFSTDRVVIRSKKRRFGLSISQVAEVLAWSGGPAWSTPETYLLGFLSWRSRPVPVIDLNRRLGLTYYGPSGPQRCLIVRTSRANEFIGLKVDSELSLCRDLEGFRPSKAEHGARGEMVAACFEGPKDLLLIPHLDRVAYRR